ncbi:MAG: flagellar biosynthesis anti-sigma factor FlgM [Sandaracinobacteroides sp.]
MGLQPASKQDGAGKVATVPADAPASVPVAEPAAGLSNLKELGASPPVDGPKVTDLKARIASGSYVLDPEAIASAMIRSETGVANS